MSENAIDNNRDRIREIFFEAYRKKTPDDRSRYLEEICGSDSELRAELESLLDAHDRSGSLLEIPPLASNVTLDDSPISESPGTTIDKYKLLEQIGEGGMAVVYMAEQEEPIKRRVALKIIKLGMDTKQVIARFEAERQALAMMDHLNIAKVFDAGSTERGRSYFVMELVRGVSITEYCDKNSLNVRERLDLFIQVCNAIQHAHQKGIIHRDIKPSNVMVTLHDGKPVCKVIDFGIAKATNQRLTERTLFTRYAQMIGTPEYMSPEQAEMSGLDVDTRTDIYSLGVLLYELLTGTLPFPSDQLRSKGYAEIQRIIHEEDPLKPSTRLSTLGEILVEVAKHHKTTPDLLEKTVRGDLDWIAMKALEKDRTRRYQTANNMAEDIKRHFNSEPVLATPPTALYHLSKFVLRNRNKVIAGIFMAASLVIGLAVATVGFVHASRERDRTVIAEKEAVVQREEAVKQREHAEDQKQVADIQRNEARRSLYCAHMLMARQDWENGRVRRLWEFLDAHRTKAGEADYRGWEWYYLEGLLRQDICALHGHNGAVRCVEWSPDGQHLASASDDHTIRIWDPVENRSVSVLKGHEASVRSVVWIEDGRRLASAGVDGTVKIWDWRVGKSVDTLRAHTGAIYSVAWDANGGLLASAGEDSTIRLWETATGQESLCLASEVRPDPIMSVAWSPDGQWLVAGHRAGKDAHGVISLWNVTTRQHRYFKDYTGHRGINSVAWNPEGRLIAATTDHLRVKVWDVITGQKRSTLCDHNGKVYSARWSPSGQHLVSASEDQTIKIWDPKTEEVLVTLCGHRGQVRSVAWRSDGHQLATGSDDGTVRIWDATNTDEAFATRRFGNWISSVSWSPDGRWLAAACLRSTVQVWDPANGQESLSLRGHNDKVWCVAWSPDGDRLATASMDKTVRIWDANDGQELLTLRGHSSDVKSVVFTSDGRRIITGSKDETIRIWDAQSGTELLSLPEHDASVRSVSLSPDGQRIASVSLNGQIQIWDPNTGDICEVFSAGISRVTALAWNPEATRLAACSDDGRIAAWETASIRQILSVQTHTGRARSVTWSQDGQRLASGGDDGTVRICDAATGERVLTLHGHDAQVFSVAWSPNGQRLASGGFDCMVKVWDAPGFWDARQ